MDPGSTNYQIQDQQIYWARFRVLMKDAGLQIGAMERIQALLQEILQCERNYEMQLRRVGSVRKDITKAKDLNQ